MLRHDMVSVSLLISAIALSVFLYTYVGLTPLLAPAILLGASVVIRVYTRKRKVQHDTEISQTESRSIITYFLLGLAGLSVFDAVGNYVFQPKVPAQILALQLPMIAMIFGAIMAISEEQFFRGELFDLLARRNVILAIGTSSVVFAGFHLQVYGTSLSSLWYVFGGGVMLAFVAWKTQRLLTPMLVHLANNLMGTFINPYIILVLALLVFFFTQRKSLMKGGGLSL